MECNTCCRKQQNKIQPASRKSKREFSRRENTRCTFSSRRHLCFRLGRSAAQNPTLPDHQHIPFRRQPANTSRHHSFHTGPQSSTSQLPSSRLGRPTPYIPSHHFFNIYKVPSSHQVSLPTILQKSTNCHLPQHPPDASPPSLHHHSVIPLIFLFLFSILPSSSRLSPFRTSSSHHSPNVLHFFRPAAASCCRFSNPQAKRET